METHLIILHISDVLESNGNPIDVTHITKYLDSFGIKDCALEETLEYLVTEGYLTGPDKGVFSLTDKGRDQVRVFFVKDNKDRYNLLMLKLWNSKAYLDFCEDLYGYRWCLLNSLYREQLQYLLNDLQISPSDTVLDVGCGSGAIISNLVDKYACKGIGVDFAHDLIAILRRHYADISFYDMEIEGIHHAPFDADIIISLDSLYFCRNLATAFAGMKARCRSHMYVFYTQSVDDESGDRNKLQSDNTDVAKALQLSEINYSAIDFSADEWNLWKKEKTILDKHRSAFEKEGNLSIWDGRVADTNNMLKEFADKRAKRFVYKVEV